MPQALYRSSKTYFIFEKHNICSKMKNITARLLVSRFYLIFTNASSSLDCITVILQGLQSNLQEKHQSDISTKASNRNPNIHTKKKKSAKVPPEQITQIQRTTERIKGLYSFAK